MPSSRRPVALLIGAMLALVAGCDRPDSAAQGPDAAPRESITVYTAIETDQLPPLLDDFRAQRPDVDVRIVRDSTGVITARLLAEGRDTPADVVWGLAATSLLLADEAGLLAPHAAPGATRLDPRMRDSRDPPRWLGTAAWMTAFTVNTIELSKRGLPIPRSFADLADPRYAGLVTMPDPGSSGTGFLTVSAVLQTMGEEAGWAYLDRLHANIGQYTHSGSKPAKLAVTGEYPIGISFCFRGLREQASGAPVEVVFPLERSGWDVEAVALVAREPVAPAARAFVDWAVSPSAFAIYGRYFGVLSDAAAAVPAPGYPPDPRAQMVENDLRWAATQRDAILARWRQRYAGKTEPAS